MKNRGLIHGREVHQAHRSCNSCSNNQPNQNRDGFDKACRIDVNDENDENGNHGQDQTLNRWFCCIVSHVPNRNWNQGQTDCGNDRSCNNRWEEVGDFREET